MESSFNRDFSSVRIHADQNAHNLNKSLGAKAFTSQNDIFFGKGEYNPHTKSGQKLLAHDDVREFYLGIRETGEKSYRDVKQYKRTRRWWG